MAPHPKKQSHLVDPKRLISLEEIQTAGGLTAKDADESQMADDLFGVAPITAKMDSQ